MDIVLSGAVTREQLRGNLAARESIVATKGLPSIALPPDQSWARRAALAWG